MTRADVTVTAAGGGVYQVAVRQGSTSTEHRVTVPAAMIDDLGLEGIDESTLVQESFAFLLERESPASIMSRFDLPVISRYFPEYEQEIRRRLG